MSWDRTCCMSTTSSSTGSASSTSLVRDYDPPPSSSSSSFFVFSSSSSHYIDEQSSREREENNYPPLYSPRHHGFDTCPSSHYPSQMPSYDISSSFQSPFIYEQYLTTLKSEQSEHLPYLFDNIIYPQPCSPPSPTNDSITYYQLDQANTTTIINKFPSRSHIQPIVYQQLSLVEPPSSNTQQKLPIVKRFYYDSNMSNTTTTTIITTTPLVTSTTNDQINLPYARLDSACFGTYDIWQERTLVGRKNNHREVDVNMGSTSVVSRIHLEFLLINGTEFHLKCLSKNGIFINNNYAKMSSITVLPKQCTLRFPSTDLCISFSSLLNHPMHRISSENLFRHLSTDTSQRRLSSSSIAMDISSTVSFPSGQQVIFVGGGNQESNDPLPPLSINIPNCSSSTSSSSLSTGSSSEQIKSQYESPTSTMNHSFLGSSTLINLKIESNGNDNLSQESDNNNSKNGTKPPFSYAQLIVQSILSAPEKQMTLSQIYSFISAQYPYYEANNRGWQNSIRHNLSLNRYFIRLARKENESGKGSFWRLDPTCEEKLIEHAFRHRKQRGHSNHSTSSNSMIKTELEEIHSPNTQDCHDPSDFLLADLPGSNPSTPMPSPLSGTFSPHRLTEDQKRKRSNTDEIEDLLNFLIGSIDQTSQFQTFKRQRL